MYCTLDSANSLPHSERFFLSQAALNFSYFDKSDCNEVMMINFTGN